MRLGRQGHGEGRGPVAGLAARGGVRRGEGSSPGKTRDFGRLKVVYVDDADEPGTLAEAERSASSKAANLKVANLRLARAVVSGEPPARTLLSALAGDASGAPPERGFFVFYPGLRLGAARALTFKEALRVDVAKMGNWGSQIATAATEAAMKRNLQAMKAEQGLPPTAWDPMHGPGWPGVYTDRAARGVADADPADVVACKSALEAWALWSEVESFARANARRGTNGAMTLVFEGGGAARVNPFYAHIPYVVPMRARLAPGTTDEAWEAAIRWLVAHSAVGVDQATNDIGLGVLGAYVIPGDDVATGVAMFATQGSYAPEDFLNNFAGDRANFALTIDGRRASLEEGRAAFKAGDDAVAPLDKPQRREWSALCASPCGRFACASWWLDGSNHDFDDGVDLELA